MRRRTVEAAAECPCDLGMPWRVQSLRGHRCGWNGAAVEQHVPHRLTSRYALAKCRVLPLLCLSGQRCIECDDLI